MKKQMLLTFDVPDDMLDNELFYAVLFAMREYAVARTPATNYVVQRYTHMSEKFKQDKIVTVQQCLDAIKSVKFGPVLPVPVVEPVVEGDVGK